MKNPFRIKFHTPRLKYAYKELFDDYARSGVSISLNTYFSVQTYKNNTQRFAFIAISILGFGFQLDINYEQF